AHATLHDALYVESELVQLEGAFARRDCELQRDGLARLDRVIVTIRRRTRTDAQVAAIHHGSRYLAVEADRQLRLERLHQQRKVSLAESEIRGRDLVRSVFQPADECGTSDLHAGEEEPRREQRLEPV